jgi:hypothetical protein
MENSNARANSARGRFRHLRKAHHMKIVLAMSGALIAAIGVWGAPPAAAQNQPPGTVMIIPGVYTTPEISAKCTAYAAKRVVGGSNTDTSRQAVTAACVRKLTARQNKKKA